MEPWQARGVFVTNHVLAGASIGLLLGDRPLVAFGAGVASHFAMDACPHWGVDWVVPGAQDRFLRAARRDGCTGLGMMALGVALAVPAARRSTALAMLGAVLPDFDKPFKHFFGGDLFPSWFDEFHGRIQRESPDGFQQELFAGVVLAGLFGALRASACRGSGRSAVVMVGTMPVMELPPVSTMCLVAR